MFDPNNPPEVFRLVAAALPPNENGLLSVEGVPVGAAGLAPNPPNADPVALLEVAPPDPNEKPPPEVVLAKESVEVLLALFEVLPNNPPPLGAAFELLLPNNPPDRLVLLLAPKGPDMLDCCLLVMD